MYQIMPIDKFMAICGGTLKQKSLCHSLDFWKFKTQQFKYIYFYMTKYKVLKN